MKSPWKMLGQLISRGRSSDPKQDTTAEDIKKLADEQALQETPASSSKAVVPPSEPHINEIQPVKGKSWEETGSGVDIAAAIPASDEQVEARSLKSVKRRRVHRGSKTKDVETIKAALPVLRTKRPGRQKRISTERVAQNSGAGRARDVPSVLSHDRFHAEVADVEAEIGALSRQLAEKLVQQNAQLRKMLERFGVS
jgi:hypothetical protein